MPGRAQALPVDRQEHVETRTQFVGACSSQLSLVTIVQSLSAGDHLLAAAFGLLLETGDLLALANTQHLQGLVDRSHQFVDECGELGARAVELTGNGPPAVQALRETWVAARAGRARSSRPPAASAAVAAADDSAPSATSTSTIEPVSRSLKGTSMHRLAIVTNAGGIVSAMMMMTVVSGGSSMVFSNAGAALPTMSKSTRIITWYGASRGRQEGLAPDLVRLSDGDEGPNSLDEAQVRMAQGQSLLDKPGTRRSRRSDRQGRPQRRERRLGDRCRGDR